MTGGAGILDVAFAGTRGRFTLDVAFGVAAPGVVALFGPSGCGKTTILRCIAGLERLSGRLTVGEEAWQDDAAGIFRKPHERAVGYVFQEASLFPHLSVRDNLAYGAKRAARRGDGTAALSLADTVDLLGMAALLDRAPAALSGGERQRVAIGRALLSRPRLLLMDEPLSALDRGARDEILPYLETLHDRLMIPLIYVSHDIGEVARLADSLVLVDGGRVLAHGSPGELEADPALPLLAAREAAVTLDGLIVGIDEAYRLTALDIAGGRLVVPGRQGAVGDHCRLRIGASDVSFVLHRPQATSILNCLPARVVSIHDHGSEEAQVNVIVALGEAGDGVRIAGRITAKSRETLTLEPGSAVFAQIKSIAVVPSKAAPNPAVSA